MLPSDIVTWLLTGGGAAIVIGALIQLYRGSREDNSAKRTMAHAGVAQAEDIKAQALEMAKDMLSSADQRLDRTEARLSAAEGQISELRDQLKLATDAARAAEHSASNAETRARRAEDVAKRFRTWAHDLVARWEEARRSETPPVLPD